MKIKWLVVIIIVAVIISVIAGYFVYRILMTPKPCGNCSSPSPTPSPTPSETETYLLPEKS